MVPFPVGELSAEKKADTSEEDLLNRPHCSGQVSVSGKNCPGLWVTCLPVKALLCSDNQTRPQKADEPG